MRPIEEDTDYRVMVLEGQFREHYEKLEEQILNLREEMRQLDRARKRNTEMLAIIILVGWVLFANLF